MSGTREAAEKFTKGQAFLQEEDYEAAVSLLSEAIALNPRMVHAYRARASAFEKLGKLNDARVDLGTINSIENAASLPPGSPSAAASTTDRENPYGGLSHAIRNMADGYRVRTRNDRRRFRRPGATVHPGRTNR